MENTKLQLENGDILGIDNDGDERNEPIHVQGYNKNVDTYVREHARAMPIKKVSDEFCYEDELSDKFCYENDNNEDKLLDEFNYDIL